MTKDTSKDQTDDLQGQAASPSADDDDIVDLLNVVTSGKTPPAPTVATPAAMKETIDSILAASDQEEQNAKPEAFPDPTPVAHQVDPDEKLDLPGLDDIDSLLKTLEAAPAAPASKTDTPSAEARPDGPMQPSTQEVKEGPTGELEGEQVVAAAGGSVEKPSESQEDEHSGPNVPLDYPDDLPAITPAAESKPFEQSAPVGQNTPAPGLSEPVVDSSTVSPENTDPSSATGTGNPPLVEVTDTAQQSTATMGNVPTTGAASEKIEQPSTTTGQSVTESDLAQTPKEQADQSADVDSTDDLDVQELDALLDDMLASAPASGAPQSAKPAMGQNAEEEQLNTLDKKVTTLLETTLPDLEQQLGALGSKLASLSEKSSSEPVDLKPLQDSLAGATTSLDQLRDELVVVSDQGKALEASVAEQQKSISSLLVRMDELEGNLERIVARAAAKVLREEIEALMHSEE